MDAGSRNGALGAGERYDASGGKTLASCQKIETDSLPLCEAQWCVTVEGVYRQITFVAHASRATRFWSQGLPAEQHSSPQSLQAKKHRLVLAQTQR